MAIYDRFDSLRKHNDLKGLSSPRACSDFCVSTPGCNSWVSAGGACYLKTGNTLIPHDTATSGIRC